MVKKQKIEVHLPKMIPAALLIELPGNPQKQSRHTFTELRRSIRENGFDESLLVVPVAEGYEIVAGNHRFRAGRAEGMEEFPCVVRDDWDEVKKQIQSVYRNYGRGKIDKAAFTKQVDKLASSAALPLDVIYEQMGFEDADAFSQFYQKEKETQTAVAAATTTAPAVRILDDLGTILSTIFAEHGQTVPNSYIIFPAGGKYHIYIASTPALKATIEKIAKQCLEQSIDINIALGGLLAIGLAQTNFLDGDGGVEVNEAGTEEGDSDLEPVE